MKIYLAYSIESRMGYALAENGQCIATHRSSNEGFAKIDMNKPDIYSKCFPDGYELIWIEDAEADNRWLSAMIKHKTIETPQHENGSYFRASVTTSTE